MRKSWRGREAHPDVWERTRGPSKGPNRVGSATQRSGRDREAPSKVLEGSGCHPVVWEAHP